MEDIRWWRDPAEYTLVAGVFEGGGAKGVAYLGAMEAIKEKGLWFNAVAGASAGAMTALAIAAGLKPECIKEKTIEIFNSIKPSIIGGLWNMKNGDGYFRKDKLKAILEEIASNPWKGQTSEAEVSEPESSEPESSEAVTPEAVTFKMLFEVTGIELNIVCADISQNRLILFNHINTPNCQVVDAALASSSIPFAFKSSVLTVSDNKEKWSHTIVDGGVSANFPIFVFNDTAFREYWKYEDTNPPKKIVGFLLGKENPEKKEESIRRQYYLSSFKNVEPYQASIKSFMFQLRDLFQVAKNIDYKNRIKELSSGNDSEQPEKPKSFSMLLLNAVLEFIFGIYNLLTRLMNPFIAPINRLRWRPSEKAWVNLLVDSLNRLLGFAAFWFWNLFIIMLLTVGAYQLIEQYLWPHYQSSSVWWIWLVISMLLATLSMSGVFFLIANRYLLIPSRRLLYGLGMTYVSGSFATPWVAKNKGVIILPVPKELGTLSFDAEEEIRDKAITNAREATIDKLIELNLKN